MTFHFQCPQGHLLAGDESQAGQQCMCPVCTTLFIIPMPLAPAFPAAPAPREETVAEPTPFSGFDPLDRTSARTPPASTPEPEPPTQPEPTAAAPASPMVLIGPELLHIPCPQGHMLETPAEMLDQEVMCPHCHVQFFLRRKDSEEHKQKKRAERVRREQRKGQALIVGAVVVVIAVLLGLGYLIVHSSGG